MIIIAEFIPFSDDDKLRASSVDLVAFLQSRGEQLKRLGHDYKLIYTDTDGVHDSIMVRGNHWYDHKNQVGGGPIKFMREFYRMTYQDAIISLLGGYSNRTAPARTAIKLAPKKEPERKPFVLPEANDNMHRAYAYLTKQRFIAPEVISFFAHKGTIYEDKTYGKEGAEIIVDNCQCTLFGSFAPNSKTAEAMSANLGKQTVLSGSLTRSAGRDGNNRQLQMIERPLMTVDELKSMPKGHFVVMKTGCHPMQTILKLFFKWGIEFEKKPYSIPEKAERKVYYSDAAEVEKAIVTKYGITTPEPPSPEQMKVTNKGRIKVQKEPYIIVDNE